MSANPSESITPAVGPAVTADTYWSAQTVLITGSSRGIGRELAMRFSRLGARVAGNYVANEALARQLLDECAPERTRVYRADVGNEDEVQGMMAAIQRDLGRVTVLVNNAGQTRDSLLMTMKTEDWRSVLATHLDGAFYCTRAVLRHMLDARHGRVVNVTSVSGVKGTVGQCNYSAAKAGLIGLTKALAREMGKKNITVNAVALGVIDTEMTRALGDQVLARYRESTALKRFGTTAEVGDLVEFLAGPKASYITGQVVVLDGGIL